MIFWISSRREPAWRWAALGSVAWSAHYLSGLLVWSNQGQVVSDGLLIGGALAWALGLYSLGQRAFPLFSLLLLPLLVAGGYGLFWKEGFSPQSAVAAIQLLPLVVLLGLLEPALRGAASEARLIWGSGLLLHAFAGVSTVWLGGPGFALPISLLGYGLLCLGAYLEWREMPIGKGLLGVGLLGLVGSLVWLGLLERQAPEPLVTLGVWGYAVLLMLGGWTLAVFGRIQRAERRLELWINLLEELATKPQSTQNLAPQGVLQSVMDGIRPLFGSLVGLEVRSDTVIRAGQNGPYVKTFELLLETPTEARLYFTSEPPEHRGLEALAPLMSERLRLSLTLNEYRSKAYSDPLTGLLNRRGFERQMQRLIRLSQENRRPITVALLDLDHFKKVNDTYGHPVGDEVLQHMAQLLRKFSRNDDLVVRLGGEEFGLVLSGANLDDAYRVLERIRQEVKVVRVGPITKPLSVSGGMAGGEIPTSMAAIHRWLEEADKVLYQAKQDGRDRIYPHVAGMEAGESRGPGRGEAEAEGSRNGQGSRGEKEKAAKGMGQKV
ncbi:MAG: GGDEF domain-containing protein [Meiothermus sp.]|nr:GGDEF domain-containing protein [Meiothermus sp.]